MLFAAVSTALVLVGLVVQWASGSLVAAVLTFAGLWAALALYVARQCTHPMWYMHSPGAHALPPVVGHAKVLYGGKEGNPLSDYDLPYTDISFPCSAGSGHTLRGWHVPNHAARLCVVFVHGGGRDRRAWLRHLPILQRAGHAALLFDCRDHGSSDGDNRGLCWLSRAPHDAAAAVKYAREALGYDKVVLCGTSQGGASSIVAAGALQADVDGVIAENPFLSREGLVTHIVHSILKHPTALLFWAQDLFAKASVAALRWRAGGHTHDPIDVVHKIDKPLLLMHSRADKLVPHTHSEELHEKAQTDVAQLWLVDDAAHTGLFDHFPEEFERRLVEFLAAI